MLCHQFSAQILTEGSAMRLQRQRQDFYPTQIDLKRPHSSARVVRIGPSLIANTGRLILLTGLLLATPIAANAEHPGFDREQRAARMQEELQLTDEQAAQVAEIMQNTRTDRGSIHENSGGDREAAREQMKVLREQTREQISTVLSTEQISQLESMRRNRMGRMHRGGQRGPGARTNGG